VEKAVAGATTLDELPSGTFVMVSHNGKGANKGTAKAPTGEKKWQSAVQGSLTTLFKKLVDDYKGLERLSSKGRT
jgi:hypothetical protein